MSIKPGNSYKDPFYDAVEARLEKKYKLPPGGIRDIRTKGERSNADQVSPVGARTVYQIMPKTRALFLKKYKIDAYASPEAASEVAALHLKESMDRNGNNWALAVREYHGGPDRSQWGKANRAYDRAVNGGGSPAAGAEGASRSTPAAPAAPAPRPKAPSVNDMLTKTPGELFSGVDAQQKQAQRTKPAKTPSVNDMVTTSLTGGDGINIGPLNRQGAATDVQAEAADVATKAEADSFTFSDRFEAGMGDWLGTHLIDAISSNHGEYDPAFMETYKQNWKTIEGFAENDDEVAQLREANNIQDLTHIQNRIGEDRERNKVLDSSGNGTAWRLGMGVIDPVGWAAGAAVSKGFGVAKIGSTTLMRSGRPLVGIASAGAEGMVGNLAVTAGLDASGDYVSTEEYQMSALTGLAIGTTLGGVSAPFVQADQLSVDLGRAIGDRKNWIDSTNAAAAEQLGPNATPEAVSTRAAEIQHKDYLDTLQYALADVPESNKLMSPEAAMTEHPLVKQAIADKADLGGISDATMEAQVAETIARADAINTANPIDKAALNTILDKVGMESTALRLLKSESPVARAVAIQLLENPNGAGGRGRSASLVFAQRDRLYNEHFSGWDNYANNYRRQEGIGWFRDHWDGKSRNDFNRRVFLEIERRSTVGETFDTNPNVVGAADLFESGMEKMRIDQQHVGVVGSVRLGADSVGYVPHRADPRKIMSLTTTQKTNVRAILSAQFQAIEGFDKKFSDTLAAKYLERAVDAGNGRYHVPFNLYSAEAGQMVKDALEALKLDPADIEKAMGKYSRGGASHTKRRLKLDLTADIGDDMKLMDLFVTDIPALFRAYSRRVSGEVALAQYGVMGKKGSEVISKAMTASGASASDMEAFDQIMSEFLNTRIGNVGAPHQFMDNMRTANSAARLGGMGFTQFAEFGNAIPALGVKATMSGIKSMPRLMAEVRDIANGKLGDPNSLLKNIDQLGGHLGLDDYNLTRYFDVRDNEIQLYGEESVGIGTRAIRGANHGVMVASGHRMILAVQTRGMAEQIIRKAIKYAKDGTEAPIGGGKHWKGDHAGVSALEDMGINRALRDKLRLDMDNIATFDGRGNLKELDLFKGKHLTPAETAEIIQAIERGASQIIQRTYIGETGKWAHSSFLKLLFQFRTFSLTSIEKQWGRNVRNYGALKSFTYLVGAASFALPIHLARVAWKAETMQSDKRGKYLEDNMSGLALTRAVMNYTSASGLSGDVLDLGAGFASSYGGDFGERFGESYGIRGKQSDKLVGGVIAPSAGLLNDAWAGVSTGDPKKLVRSLPGSNLPYVAPFINAALAAAEEGKN